jgi:hypothetical protein
MVKELGCAQNVRHRPLFVEVSEQCLDREAIAHAKRVLEKYLSNP